MEQLRPAGAGRRAQAAAIVRSSEPRAVLVVATDDDVPSDWPTGAVGGLDANLGHALGWTCEVRADDIVVLNPLGEGWLRAERPELGADWRDNAGHSASCSLLVVAPSPEGPLAALAAAEAAGTLRGATIRTAISDQAAPTVGRNAPCPCGSGKKFKHCCG